MKLRVFAILHEQHGSVNNPQFRKQRIARDFPEETKPKDAFKAIHKEFGRLGDSKLWDDQIFPGQKLLIAPSKWVEISSHTVVDEKREPVELEGWRAQEQDLLAPMDLKNALSRKPEATPWVR